MGVIKIVCSDKDNLKKYEKCALAYGERTPAHWHSCFEIICVEREAIRLSIRKKTYDVKKGDIAVIKSCDYHVIRDGYSHPDGKSTILKMFRFSPSRSHV